MAWIGVLTDEGVDMIAQLAGGLHTMTITGAVVGSGTWDEEDMRGATALNTQEDTAAVASSEVVTGGVKLKIRVSATSGTAYTAHEIGIMAKIDNGTAKLLSLHQDSDTGIDVPTATDSPEFFFDLVATLGISNTDNLAVSITQGLYVTQEDFEDELDLKANKEDTVLSTTLSRGRKAGSSIGTGSLAFGNDVVASGDYAVAEGVDAEASGYASQAHGCGTKASRKSVHVVGAYNVEDTNGADENQNGTFVEIVGNGQSNNSRSNARAVDFNGNEYLRRDVHVNSDKSSKDGIGIGRFFGLLAISPYSSNMSYYAGALVSHEGKAYKCITDIPFFEQWNSSHWHECGFRDVSLTVYTDSDGIAECDDPRITGNNNYSGSIILYAYGTNWFSPASEHYIVLPYKGYSDDDGFKAYFKVLRATDLSAVQNTTVRLRVYCIF